MGPGSHENEMGLLIQNHIKEEILYRKALAMGLASTGWIHLPQRPVEIIIALSLVFLGLEAARGNKQTLACQRPWLVAVLFGLIP